jgi:FkbM family methyltransferase
MRSRSLSFLLNSKYKFLRKIYFVYNIYIRNFKFLKKSSQFNEEIFLLKYFKNYKKGKYLDLGCFHPVRDNNTYQLYKKNWNGINIDLNPLTIELFNFSRPKDINLNTALSRKSGIKKFYYFGEFSPLNTLDSNHLKFLKKNFNIKRNQYKIKKIKTKNINFILNKYKLIVIDFLSIDLEGNEYEVLRDLNFKKYKINLLSVEMLFHNPLSEKISKKLDRLLIRNNFKFVYKTGVNYFYKNTKWNYL